MQPSIQFVKRNDGVKIAYVQFGQGPPLVCPAPWVTSLSYILEDHIAGQIWDSLSRDVTLVLYDKHGCGQSDRDRKEFSLEAELIDLETVVSHLKLKTFNLLGSSAAGPVAIAYTAENLEKVSRLILYGTYARGKDLATDDMQSALVSLVKASWGVGSRTLAEIFIPGADFEELHSFGMFTRKSSSPDIAAKLMELSYHLDVMEKLATINVPTLILHREGDKLIAVDHGRMLAGEIPNAKFKILQGDIHPWWFGDSAEIISEILTFLGKSDPATSDVGNAVSKKAPSFDEQMAVSPFDISEVVEQATIVFTDIVSSTSLVNELGDATAREIFLKHDNIVRMQIEKHNGRELQNLGDGFMLSFETASNAIKCAQDIQKHITKELPAIQVRIGVHSGEVVRREGRHPFGRAVVIASRFLSQAQGEQILASDVTRQIVSGGKFLFAKVDSFTPKGFDENMDIFEIAWN